jgi:superfamily II DNA or RNA helicase
VTTWWVGRENDLLYHPETASLEPARVVLPKRLLILGTVSDLDLGIGVDAEVRSAVMPDRILATGIYAFRTDTAWDMLICLDGLPPGASMTYDEDEILPDHPLLKARIWFDALWGSAKPVGRTARFRRGDHVRLAGSKRVGRVERDPTKHGDSWLYAVMIDQVLESVSESGLESADVDLTDPVSWVRQGAAPASRFASSLTFTKLSNPLTDTVYSYLSTKTVYRPYQFRPVLRLLNSPTQRLLIADEVGLGKTIEAGLIWTELEARGAVRRALVVCPASLIAKWKSEMRRRFDRDLREVDKAGLDDLVALFRDEDDATPFFGVVSLERLRRAVPISRLLEVQARFDLVIVDEAHYLRTRGSLSHELGRVLSDIADTLIFLSATPLNLGHDDLFNLLSLLAEEEFSDRYVFGRQVEPNRLLNAASKELVRSRGATDAVAKTLDSVRYLEFGAPIASRPEFEELEALVGSSTRLDWAQVADARRLLAELNTLGSVLTRTRKADVPDARAVREPVSIEVEWSPEERLFYRAVLDWAYQRAKASGAPVGFVTQMPLRQAASCLQGMKDLLGERDPALFSDDPYGVDDIDDMDWDASEDAPLSFDAIRSAVVGWSGRDTKFERFEEALRDVQGKGIAQVMVFSYFRRTLGYLYRQLRKRGFRVRMMDGSTPMPERLTVMDDFRSGDFDILLCSEVGSEGLDFEFCSVLVNYDLPWNPMKVEQRIGRLDRFGQKSDKIRIYNFHVPGTIETEIFERLYRRIGVFEASIGELEPILRDEFSTLTRVALDPNLTDEQRQRKVDLMEIAVEKRRLDIEGLQEADGLLAGVDQLLIDGLERSLDNGRFISGQEIRALLEQWFSDGSKAKFKGRSPLMLEGDAGLAEEVVFVGSSAGGSIYRVPELVRRLRDGEDIPVTFDNEEASRSSLDLISLRHPVVRAALRSLRRDPGWLARYGSVSLPRETIESDVVVVFHIVQTTGLRASLELVGIGINPTTGEVVPETGERLLSALATGDLLDAAPIEERLVLRGLDLAGAEMARRQTQLEDERRQTNEALVEARIATQRASSGLKIDRARSTLESTSRNPSLARMYRGRIANLETQLREKLGELDDRRELAVTVRPVAVACIRRTEEDEETRHAG